MYYLRFSIVRRWHVKESVIYLLQNQIITLFFHHFLSFFIQNLYLLLQFVPFCNLSSWWRNYFIPVVQSCSSALFTSKIQPANHLKWNTEHYNRDRNIKEQKHTQKINLPTNRKLKMMYLLISKYLLNIVKIVYDKYC